MTDSQLPAPVLVNEVISWITNWDQLDQKRLFIGFLPGNERYLDRVRFRYTDATGHDYIAISVPEGVEVTHITDRDAQNLPSRGGSRNLAVFEAILTRVEPQEPE